MEENYFENENSYVRNAFDLEYILAFQTNHDMQIIRGEDYQYMCYIDKEVYGGALTPLCALVTGIELYNKYKTN